MSDMEKVEHEGGSVTSHTVLDDANAERVGRAIYEAYYQVSGEVLHVPIVGHWDNLSPTVKGIWAKTARKLVSDGVIDVDTTHWVFGTMDVVSETWTLECDCGWKVVGVFDKDMNNLAEGHLELNEIEGKLAADEETTEAEAEEILDNAKYLMGE